MSTTEWDNFLQSLIPEKASRDTLQRSIGASMGGVAFKTGHLSSPSGKPLENAGRFCPKLDE